MKATTEELRESTSIKIKPSVWKKAKIEAITENKQLSELVEEALEAWFDSKRKNK
ncbi:MAG: hypothetical protein ACREBI_08500 [Nitrosotalea sp.]